MQKLLARRKDSPLHLKGANVFFPIHVFFLQSCFKKMNWAWEWGQFSFLLGDAKTKCKPHLFPASLWGDEPVEQVQVDLLAKDARDVFEASPEIKYCQCLLWNIIEWRLLSCCLLRSVPNQLLNSFISIFGCDVHTSTLTIKTLAEIHHSFSRILTLAHNVLKTRAQIYKKLFLAKKNLDANNTTE